MLVRDIVSFMPLIEPELQRIQQQVAQVAYPDPTLRHTDPAAYWDQVARFNDELITTLQGEGKVLPAIAESNDLSDDTAEALKTAVERLKEAFYVEEESSAA